MVTTAILMSSTLPAEEVFSLEHLRVKIPSYSRILASRICAKCGEKIMETKAVNEGKVYYCLNCGEEGYGQLDWTGIHCARTLLLI